MHWDMINAVATVAVAVTAPAAAIAWRFVQRRSHRRNGQGECAACGISWSEIGIAPVEYQVHGAHVCAPCAHRIRRRTIFGFGALALATGLASAAALPHLPMYARPPYNWPWWALAWTALPPFALAAATTVAFRRMKRDNRTGLPGGPSGASHRSKQLLNEGHVRDVQRPPRTRTDESQNTLLAQAT